MVLTVSFVLSLVSRAFLSPSPRNAKHCRELMPASRHQDHTLSPSASDIARQSMPKRPSHPTPTFMTVAKRPSFRCGMARAFKGDLPDVISEISLQRGLDNRSKSPSTLRAPRYLLTLWSVLRVVAEPGGAAALAARLSGRYRPGPGERVAVVLCGANRTAVSFEGCGLPQSGTPS